MGEGKGEGEVHEGHIGPRAGEHRGHIGPRAGGSYHTWGPGLVRPIIVLCRSLSEMLVTPLHLTFTQPD